MMRSRAQALRHMEALSLLPNYSWTVLVLLLTQELSCHPPGTNKEERDEGEDSGLTKAPVHHPNSPPSNRSVSSIRLLSK